MNINERLRTAIENSIESGRFKNASALASAVGISQGTLNLFLNGERESMGMVNAEKIITAIGGAIIFPEDREEADQEDVAVHGTMKRLLFHAPVEVVEGDELPTIPVMGIAGAGPGYEEFQLEPLRLLPVLEKYAIDGVYAFQVQGDSMEPTIKNGAYVGIVPVGRLQEGGIYLIWEPYFGSRVKRVIPGKEGIILRSDNKDYEDVPIPYEGYENIIKGQVVWVWQQI